METKMKRQTFDEAFKREAVALWLQGNKPLERLAGDLGMGPKSLRDWKESYGPPVPVAQQRGSRDRFARPARRRAPMPSWGGAFALPKCQNSLEMSPC